MKNLAAKKESKKKTIGRETRIASLTGITGCGKSYESKLIAKKLAATNNKVLVVTYAGSGKTWNMCKKIAPSPESLSFNRGWKKIHYVEHENEHPLQLIANNYRNGVLILDDCRLYMYSNWDATKGLKVLVIDHRHMGLDLLMIAHTPLQIPKQCWAFMKFSWIFKCIMKLKESDMPMENFQQFLEAQDKVNARYKEALKKEKTPRGICEFIRN